MKYLWLVLLLSGFASAGEIHELAGKGDLDAVQRLLDAGISVDERDAEGQTALIHAVMAGQTPVVRLLLTRGANPLHRVRMGRNMQNPWTLAQGLAGGNDTPNSRNILLALGMAMHFQGDGPVDQRTVTQQAVTIDAGQEKLFSDEFSKKFAKDLREQIRARGHIEVRMSYGSYLYYVAVLHAYRIMLNNFRARDSWAAMETVQDVTTFPAALAFINDMRRFLIDRTGSAQSRARVMLFINTDGVINKNGLSYGHFKQVFPEHAGVIAHFGFNGLHFVIVDNDRTMIRVAEEFRAPNMRRFDIDPLGGRFGIKQAVGAADWPVPPYLKNLLRRFDAFSEEQLGLSGDWHWYTDEEVNQALRLRLQEENLGEDQSVIRIAPLGGTVLGGQLRTHLSDEMTDHSGLSWDRIVLLPYNIGNQHWVGLVIQIRDGRVTAEYYDSLAERPEMPAWVTAELQSVYGRGVSITAAANLLQMDSHSCGPLMVENLVQRALGIRQQAPRFSSHSADNVRGHHSLLMTADNWAEPFSAVNHIGSFFTPYAPQAAWIFAALFSYYKKAP